MIYITGDTHGDWMSRLNSEAFPEGKEMTKNDHVIICGDFGIWQNSNDEKYRLNWLDEKPFTTVFVDGNHENFDILNAFEVSEWNGGKVHKINDSVYHLMRGQVFTIEGLKFFTFGGASSHDIQDGILDPADKYFLQKKKELDDTGKYMYRIKHFSWWEEELPSDKEMVEGLENLDKHNNEVDYIISHSPHSSLTKQLGWGLYECDRLTHYLQKVRSENKFRQHFFGHMHIDENFPWEKAVGLYEQIIRII